MFIELLFAFGDNVTIIITVHFDAFLVLIWKLIVALTAWFLFGPHLTSKRALSTIGLSGVFFRFNGGPDLWIVVRQVLYVIHFEYSKLNKNY